jgi:hypothetical protein
VAWSSSSPSLSSVVSAGTLGGCPALSCGDGREEGCTRQEVPTTRLRRVGAMPHRCGRRQLRGEKKGPHIAGAHPHLVPHAVGVLLGQLLLQTEQLFLQRLGLGGGERPQRIQFRPLRGDDPSQRFLHGGFSSGSGGVHFD